MPLTLVLGGIASGKSAYAESLATGGVLYVATTIGDPEDMHERIAAHRARRPAGWPTLVAVQGIALKASREFPDCHTVLLDGFGLVVGAALETPDPGGAIEREIRDIAADSKDRNWIVVSEESGLSPVALTPLGRHFQDLLGRGNQLLSAAAQRAVLVVAGRQLGASSTLSFTSRAPYTAGELLQGLIGGVHLHVSLPIDRFARAEFQPGADRFEGSDGSLKSFLAVLTMMRRFGLAQTGKLQVTSSLPHSKGLGTSTADIAASLSAVAAAHELTLAPAEIAEFAVSIEPTDGSIFPGIVLFDHRRGEILEFLGEPPPAKLLVVDTGGTVDTIQYNVEVDEARLLVNEAATRSALQLARRAIETGDLEALGAAARLSAASHQAILPKPGFDEIDAIGRRFGALGIAVGHSGSVCTLIFRPDASTEAAASTVSSTLGFTSFTASLRGGGVIRDS